MRRKGRGLVKKRQQATEKHNPTKSGLTSILGCNFRKKKKKHLCIYNLFGRKRVKKAFVVLHDLDQFTLLHFLGLFTLTNL